MEDESDEDGQQGEIYITRSGRTVKPTDRLTYDAQACLLTWGEQESQESWKERHLLAYKASTDPDTMCYHQAMKKPDKDQFLAAIDKEFDELPMYKSKGTNEEQSE